MVSKETKLKKFFLITLKKNMRNFTLYIKLFNFKWISTHFSNNASMLKYLYSYLKPLKQVKFTKKFLIKGFY